MYVCVCHGITDRQINQAVDAGAHSLRLVRKQLPVGSNCGRCLDCAAQIVKQRVGQRVGQCSGAAACGGKAAHASPSTGAVLAGA